MLKREASIDLLMFLSLATVAIVGRLVSNAFGIWNFTPVAAVALFAGYYFRQRWAALLMPMTVMMVSNLAIGSYESRAMMLVVYGAMLIPTVLAEVLRRNLTAGRVFVCALSSSVTFFLITNLAQWYFHRDHSVAELWSCYIDALPFFRATLTGDLFWSGVIFGGYALAASSDFLPRRYVRVPVESDPRFRRK